ncbi:MAG: type 2 lanthipeptide synthetase LanM family protein, partial [Acidobacteriota bacterium]
GWVEFIDASPCEDEAQIRRFYLRQGGYLAILYILRANDIHFENLIAIGEHPVIIDLEAILQPGPPREDSAEPDPLQDSIIRVGLLPVRTWQNESSPGLDVSALGGAAGQMSPRPEASWAKSGTDHMRYARKTRALPLPARHRPALDGTAQPALRYLDEIKTGFETLYRLFLTHRAELLADDGPLTAFKGEDIRVLLRPTNLYAIVLRDSFHPQFLGDALERDLFFDKLWRQVPRHPHLRQVIGAEQHALHQRDIPLFRAHSDSRTVRSTTGETWPDFFTASGMSLVRDRIEELGEKDLRTQLWFIEASMAILSDDERERPTPRTAQRQTTTPLGETEPVSTDRLIELASTIGEALATNCLEERESIRWLGLQPTMAGAYQIALSGTGLYSGQPGITLFLAYLAALSDHDRLRAVAELSCATLLDDVRHDTPADIRKIGAFDGLTGLLFTFVHLASLWQRSDLLEHALDLCARIDPWIDDDQRFDVVHGAAGTILALAAIHDMRPRPAILETMVRCGDHLLAHARHDENGASWLTSPEATVPLAGFAHGTAGIATALVELAARVDEGRFLEVAHQALRYERGLFSPEHGNWPDLRTDAKQPHDLYYWCHGAPGIGLGRTLVLRHEDNAECREDLELALRATTAHGFGLNHSLCHGDLGNLDILRVAATTTHADWLHEIIDTQATRLATEISEYGWRCGLPMEVESPGLMVGLAGVGYGLLRLAEPRRVPSLLALEPPRGPSPTLNEQKTLD